MLRNSTKKIWIPLTLILVLTTESLVYARPVKTSVISAESARTKTLQDFSKINFTLQVPQDLKTEEELKIQERMVAEIKKLRSENSSLDEKTKQLENIITLSEQLSKEKDTKISKLESLLAIEKKLDTNNQEIIKNLRTENNILKAKTDFLEDELRKAQKSKNKRAAITTVIGFILGVAAKAFLF